MSSSAALSPSEDLSDADTDTTFGTRTETSGRSLSLDKSHKSMSEAIPDLDSVDGIFVRSPSADVSQQPKTFVKKITQEEVGIRDRECSKYGMGGLWRAGIFNFCYTKCQGSYTCLL
uniref:Uncharacterized protein n=1 Tax=Eutreptiella gymnastica TaxID=73025 RepID=A0A7S1IWZ4_9EUGL|mmetsp:Transcript_49176/g.87792  ORF Transcript_49176/g.87792 Transcript_49176/m.87792 type:complete len:117 (+) Transcript_49176:461-811(+)